MRKGIDLAIFDTMPRKYRLGILAAALGFTAVITWVAFYGIIIERKIPATRIYHSAGFRHYTTVMKPPWPFFVLSDRNEAPKRARTMVHEQNRPLGPPHSRTKDIASFGLGRFKHFRTTLFFSAIDNSNPRRNGRVYSVNFAVAIRPGFAIAAFVIFLFAVLLNAGEVLRFRR